MYLHQTSVQRTACCGSVSTAWCWVREQMDWTSVTTRQSNQDVRAIEVTAGSNANKWCFTRRPATQILHTLTHYQLQLPGVYVKKLLQRHTTLIAFTDP
jgi:hypothetical protein